MRIFVLVALFWGWTVWAAERALPGEPAPALNLEKLLQAPEGATANWEALKGKVVILEFWATWCGPCIEAVPHLNELADEFKTEPVQFIAITDEKESVVTPFLKRKAMRAWVGLDTDRSMFKEYGISGIPQTVLVGSNGVIAGATHPSALTAAQIKNVLAGKAVAVAPPRGDERRVPAEPSEIKPLFQVVIQPSEESQASSSSGARRPTAYGQIYESKWIGHTLAELLPSAFKVSSTRIVTNAALAEGRFDAHIKLPVGEQGRVAELLQDALHTTFGLVARKESREMDTYELRAKNPKLEETVSTGGSSSSAGPGRISAVNGSMSGLARALEGRLRKPVFNETRLTNRYDYELKWEETDDEKTPADTIVRIVREKLGLELVPAKREVEVTVIEVEKGKAGKASNR